MSDGWSSITVESFEMVPVGASLTLLRVTGRGSRWRAAGPRPKLVIERDGTEHRFDPLPAPDDSRGLLRAAYSVPAGLAGDDGRFRLEHRPDVVTELSAPSRRKALGAAAPAAPSQAGVGREAPASPQPQLQQVQEQLGAALAERDQLTRRVMELEQSAGEAAERLREAEAANQLLTESHQELDTWRGELERRLADTTTELSVARVERDSAREELQAVHGELRGLREELRVAHEELRTAHGQLQTFRAGEDEPAGAEPAGAEPAGADPTGEQPSSVALSEHPSESTSSIHHEPDLDVISQIAEQRAVERAQEELRALLEQPLT